MAEQYAELLVEAEAHGLAAEQATALLGLGECALETGELVAGRRVLRAVRGLSGRGAAARPGPGPARPGRRALSRR